MARFGRLDLVVNCAGATQRGDFLALSDEAWADGYALKLFGAVRLTRAAWPHLRAVGGGVVTIAGVGGKVASADFTIGGSVNAALMNLTKALADKGVAEGVRVNCINPGSIRTDRLTGRIATLAAERGLDEAAAAVALARDTGVARSANRPRSRPWSPSSPATRPPMSRGRSWTWTAAGSGRPRRSRSGKCTENALFVDFKQFAASGVHALRRSA